MTLRELINSVDAEQYSESTLFLQLTKTKPEYGTNRHIQVTESDGNIIVSGVHVGSLGDILTYSIDVDPNLNVSKTHLMDAILKELSADGFTAPEQEGFWNDFDNLQKAKIIR
ncbi:hypothetical protein SAMN04487901_1392 [Prevotella communis]|uniref:Uncharacterized protein n=1 Tax=Prevotella communis TaxID=2913614 RepID=A0A1G8CNC8_9BACT|nr:hypothetical protein [Prevotella communis]SDH46975.1 hypothetical protein SAMN04487901_1392 [Prevotella communis]